MSCDIRYQEGVVKIEIQNFENVSHASKWASEKGLEEYTMIVHK